MKERTVSSRLFRRACSVMPGGVSSPVRAFKSVGGEPVYFKKAAGSGFIDEDGNRYTDYCMSWGPLILGHAHPSVVEAVKAAAEDGLSYGACCAREVELAELVLEAFPRMEQVRFVSSGTEAVMTALRLARGVTGRPRVLKFEGGYHGHSDSMLVKAGSGLATFGTSSSLGVPASIAGESIVVPFDDDAALEEAFRLHGDSLAAAIVEPLPANNGLLVQRPQWLRLLRDLTKRHGALLIFDEVISGFRLRYGGYGDGLGIEADLVTLGKILGGGMPAAALAGKRAVMETLAPVGGVYQAGTLSGNPVSLSAGIATLKLLKSGEIYRRLETLGSVLDSELDRLRQVHPFLNRVRVGSVVWLYMAEGPIPRTVATISPEAVKRFNGLYHNMLDRGIYLPPSAYEVLFLSDAHTAGNVTTLAASLGGELSAPKKGERVMKERLLIKGYHALFAVSIAALVALGVWWTVFIGHAIEVERRSALKELEHASELVALELGHAQRPPLPGAIAGTRLEIVPTLELIPGGIGAGLRPLYGEYSVRPLKEVVDGISARTLRRKVMVAGEGSLLFVLLGICTVMLYVLARSEKKQARAMEQFISTVTHEMKTPLTGLKSLVQTFSSGMVPKGREQELLTMGLKEIERLDHMIENVLISGRLRTEWYRLEDETVPLRGILDSFIAHRRLYMSGGQGTIELNWEPKEPDLSVKCDRKAVLVILENLTDNAQKYSTAAPEITVAVRRDGRGVRVAVEDKGIGFEPSLADELFMPFVRAAGPGVDSRHGTGLGLAISRSLARRMGGDLRAESGGPGKGSRFTLTLKGTQA